MAVDTETKRRSALGMLIISLVVAPVPDGTVAAVDREHIIGIYAGIAPAAPGVLTSNIHIFSDSTVEPEHVVDNAKSVLIKDSLEVQWESYFGGPTDYTEIDSQGRIVMSPNSYSAVEQGAIEYDGQHLLFTESVDRRVISLASDSIVASTTTVSTSEVIIWTGVISAAELHIGKVINVRAFGDFSTHDANDQVTVKVKLGSIVVVSLQSTAGSVTDVPWHLMASATIRTIGVGGTVSAHGHIMLNNIELHTNTKTTAINTTIVDNVTITAQWSDISNELHIDQAYMEILV